MNNGKGCLLAINSYFIFPNVIIMTLIHFVFGRGDDNYWLVLTGNIAYIVVSIVLIIKYAAQYSTTRDKKIFAIGITLLIIALFVFYKFVLRR